MAQVNTAIGKGVVLMPGKIKTKHYVVTLPAELHGRLMKPVKGEGGWQNLMKELQLHTQLAELTVTLPDPLFRKMIPYATGNHSGGFQNVVRWLLCCLLEQHGQELLGEAPSLKSMVKGNGGA